MCVKPVRHLHVVRFSFRDFLDNRLREGRSILMVVDKATPAFTHAS
jgi:hypothetical protein